MSNPQTVCLRYAALWFWLDLITSFPVGSLVETLYWWFDYGGASIPKIFYAPQALRILRLLKLLKLARVSRFGRAMRDWRDARARARACGECVDSLCSGHPQIKKCCARTNKVFSTQGKHVGLGVKLILRVTFIAHLCACAWAMTNFAYLSLPTDGWINGRDICYDHEDCYGHKVILRFIYFHMIA